MYERATRASKGPRHVGVLRALETRIRTRLYGDRRDDGFILLESIVSIFLITILMTAMTTFLTTTTQTTNHLRIRQEAIQLADSAIERAHSYGPTTLVLNRTPAAVQAQFAAALSNPALSPAFAQTVQTSDPTNPPAVTEPATPAACSVTPSYAITLPTLPVCQQVGAHQFETTYYLGQCYAAISPSASCTQSRPGQAYVTYLRLIVAVTWADNCTTSSCLYYTSTLINPDENPTVPASVLASQTFKTDDQVSYVHDSIDAIPFTASGGVAPFTYTATGLSSLGQNMSMDATTGLVTGNITGPPQTYGLTMTVVDGLNNLTSYPFTWTVYALPNVSLASQNTAVNASVNVTPVFICSYPPCTFTETGLPTDLKMDPNTGVITGQPTAASFNTVNITITDLGAKNSDGTYVLAPKFHTTTLTWRVWAGPIFTTTDQVNYVGTSVSLAAPTVNGYPTVGGWAAAGLPPGVSFNQSTGVFSGTPTTPGNYIVTVSVGDGFLQRANSTFHWTIFALPSITMANQNTTISAPVNVTPTYTCSNGPCTFTALDLPTGLSIDPATGAITGRPTAAAVNTVTITITDQGVKNADGTYAIAPMTASTTFTWSVLTAATQCVPQIALANGSFEAPGPPTVNPGAPNWLVGGSTPLLWDTTEPDNTIEIWKNDDPTAKVKAQYTAQAANGGMAISAEDGTQWAELNANQTGALYQDINTVPGQILQWSVWHRGRYSGAANASKKDVMQVQIGTTTTQTPQVPTGQNTPDIADGPTAWVLYRGIYTVPAGQTTTRFQFAAISTASGNNSVGNFIDNLSLNNYIACLSNLPGDQLNTVNTAIPALQLSATRGSGQYTWGGGNTLPAGLSITSAGLITGTPTTTGSTSVVLTLKDTVTGFVQSVAFKWTIVPPPTVTAPANQTTSAGTAVNLQLTTSCLNVTCSYTMTGGPSGLTVTNTGLITGTVTGASFTFTPTVTVRDSQGVQASSSPFTWSVLGGLAVVSPGDQSSLRASAVNLDMSAHTSGGSPPYTYSASNLPPWLSINPSTGRITGTTPAGTSSVTSGITITARDSLNATSTSGGFSWTVYAAPSVTAPANLASSVGTIMNQQLTASCPNAPCTFAINGAPGGVSVTGGGVITGTVGAGTAAVYSGVTVVITDASGNTGSSSAFSWTVNPAPALANPGDQRVRLSAAVNLDLSALASGGTGTYTYSASGLPNWLSINPTSGTISGTAPSSASNALGITATITDATGATSTTAAFSYTVTNALNSSISSQTTYQSTAVSLDLNTFTTGGTAPYTYLVTGLPTWLSYNNTTGIISGTAPTASGTTQTTGISVRVADNVGATVTVGSLAWYLTNLRWANPTTVTTARGSYVDTNIASYLSGGTGAVSYSATKLPTGVFMTGTGVLTGTASTPGVWSTVLSATDSAGATVTSTYTWTVS